MGYSVVDISEWQYINKYVSGSKEKRWYKSKEKDKMALFKVPISFTSDTQTILNEISGEPWSEKISSEIGKAIGSLALQENNIKKSSKIFYLKVGNIRPFHFKIH